MADWGTVAVVQFTSRSRSERFERTISLPRLRQMRHVGILSPRHHRLGSRRDNPRSGHHLLKAHKTPIRMED
ncbi:unnamed protein product, partial [Nesidiocoris tenuis]